MEEIKLKIRYNKEAIKRYDEALQTKLSSFQGADISHDSARILMKESKCLIDLKGEIQDAIDSLERCRLILDQKDAFNLGNDYHYVEEVRVHKSLGDSLFNKSKYTDALKSYQKSLELQRENDRRKFLPKMINHIAGCLNEIASCYLRKKDNQKASESLEAASKIMLQIDEGERDEPLNADIFCNFAEVEMANGEHARLSQALVYANKGKEIKARLYGEISPFAVTCSNLIARIFLRKGEYDRAIEYYKKSLEIQKKIYEKEPNHLQVAFVENSIAYAYLEKHKSISNKSNNALNQGTYYIEKALEKILSFNDIEEKGEDREDENIWSIDKTLSVLINIHNENNDDSKVKTYREKLMNLQRTNNKRINLLGFDGGGSRGVMEAMILDDFMRLVTKMTKDPARFENLPELIKGRDNGSKGSTSVNASDVESSLGQDFRKLLEQDLEYSDVIHPTKIFDMIAGTSTGSLIAYGLVCGNKEKNLEHDQEGSSDLMSVEEIIELYRTAAKNIFIYQGREMNWIQKVEDWLKDWRIYPLMVISVAFFVLLSIDYMLKYFWPSFDNWLHEIVGLEISLACLLLLTTIGFNALGKNRSQRGLEQELHKTFGNHKLGDVFPSKKNNHCIAAAIAKEMTPNKREADVLEIFDTSNPNQQHFDIKSVLKASCDAPKYFEIPVEIGSKKYVDGGVTGNCPLKEAYRQLLRIKGYDSRIETAISIAPPNIKPKISLSSGRIGKFKEYVSLLHYAVNYLTDGSESFKELKNNNETLKGKDKTIFVRASPISKKAEKFKMDETNIDKMIAAINEERNTEPKYYEKIMDMAALTVSRLVIEKDHDEYSLYTSSKLSHFLAMMKNIVNDMKNRPVDRMERKDLDDVAQAITKNISSNLNEIGMYHSKLKNYENASIYLNEALRMCTFIGDENDPLASSIQCNLTKNESLN